MTTAQKTVDPEEVSRFRAIAKEWWDPNGQFRPLHAMNPTRLSYTREALLEHFELDGSNDKPLLGLSVLDVGCGGGLVTEPLTRLGATVTGIDAEEISIGVAKAHAKDSGLNIDYRVGTVEDIVAEGEKFDIIVNYEVIEHVADVDAFLTACRAVIKPSGMMLISTLNRTKRSYLGAIIAAEHILRWVPRGTHTHEKFLKPSEFRAHLQSTGFVMTGLKGVSLSPISGWALSDDLSVNYIGTAVPI